MQDYHEFMRELRSAASHIGQRLTAQMAESRMSAGQIKRRRAQNFMTSEKVEYRAMAGSGRGPLVVEISHGAFMDSRVIGLTVFHTLPEHMGADHDESGAVHSVAEMAARLRELNGGE